MKANKSWKVGRLTFEPDGSVAEERLGHNDVQCLRIELLCVRFDVSPDSQLWSFYTVMTTAYITGGFSRLLYSFLTKVRKVAAE